MVSMRDERADPVRPIFANEKLPAEELEKEDSEMEDEAGVRVPVVKRGPKEPTEKEITAHNVTHVPFRSWCPHCVSAAAKATPHRSRKEESEKSIPCIHADYWFMRDQPGAESVPVICLKDDDTKAFGAHVVTVKGSVDWVAEKIVEDIEIMGHIGKVAIKTDQEPALKDLVREIHQLRAAKGRETIPEESKVYDSQSNGTAERAVQSVECIARTHKFALEKRIGKKVPCTHPLMTWLVEHSVDMLNKYKVGADGRTAYERIRGKKYTGEMIEFGRRVYHMFPGKHQGGSMRERWGTGVFLGKLWSSDEYMIFGDDGKLVKARSIKFMLDKESWDHGEIDKVSVFKWKAQFSRAEVPLEERDEDGGVEPTARKVIPRDFKIKQEHLNKFGYSEDCGRCRGLRRGVTPSMAHTKECRDRVRGLIEDSGESETLARAVLRRNEFLSEEVRAGEEKGEEIVQKRPGHDHLAENQGESALYGGEGDPGSSSRGGVPVEPVIEEASDEKEEDEELPEVPDSDLENSGDEETEATNAKRKISAKDDVGDPPEEGNRSKKPRQDNESNYKTNKRSKDTSKENHKKKRRKDKEQVEIEKDLDDFFNDELLHLTNSESSSNTWEKNWVERNPVSKLVWNIEDEIVQKKLVHLLHVHKPKFIMCEAVSKVSNKWKNPAKINEFINRVCGIQRRADRKFIAYQEMSAPRWACRPWDDLRRLQDVHQIGVHLDVEGWGNAVRLTTNSEQIVEAIKEKTNLKFEERVQKGLDLDICKRDQIRKDLFQLNSPESLHYEDICGNFIDDSTGFVLDQKETSKARKLEMNTFKEMDVYDYITREEAKKDKDGKIVGVRWVDIQKGALVRSRLVAQEFAGKDEREDIFAATPPLFATKVVISDAASRGDYGQGDRVLLILDVKRAFLYGDIEDNVYIELPPEDPYYGQGYVGALKKAMYGTRGAPRVWQKVVKKVMTSLGFAMNPIHPCVYHHPKRDILVVTHVDDFLCSGRREDMRWLTKEIHKEFEIKSEVVGNQGGEVREGQFLGRTIRWTTEGYEYEGNQKHSKILLDEWDMNDAKSLSSPGAAVEKPDYRTKAEEEKALNAMESKDYRRAAARINYMSLDRADLSFASKEASRGMARPTVGDVVRLKRILRYLKGRPRAVNVFRWQGPQNTILGLCDSDWAGCVRTRKSTSGGVILLGKHLISHWSSSQTVVALSSAEAELNALVKMTSEALGVRNLFKAIGYDKGIILKTDSSACNGIVHREGCGKVKHLEARQLWVQDVVSDKIVAVQKVPREHNYSDMLTHHWSAKDGLKHFDKVGLKFL